MTGSRDDPGRSCRRVGCWGSREEGWLSERATTVIRAGTWRQVPREAKALE